jgi:hypothetical protein
MSSRVERDRQRKHLQSMPAVLYLRPFTYRVAGGLPSLVTTELPGDEK